MTQNRFFSDDLDGVGTVGYSHIDGSTQSIVTLDDKELGERAAEHLNEFFGSDFSKPLLDYVERLPESQNLSNIEVLLTDFLLWSTGGEDKNFETSYDFLCESAQSYVKHIDEMWEGTDVRVAFEHEVSNDRDRLRHLTSYGKKPTMLGEGSVESYFGANLEHEN